MIFQWSDFFLVRLDNVQNLFSNLLCRCSNFSATSKRQARIEELFSEVLACLRQFEKKITKHRCAAKSLHKDLSSITFLTNCAKWSQLKYRSLEFWWQNIRCATRRLLPALSSLLILMWRKKYLLIISYYYSHWNLNIFKRASQNHHQVWSIDF